jgi:beta/gamma crystallin
LARFPGLQISMEASMKTLLAQALAMAGLVIGAQAFAQVNLYEHDYFRGAVVVVKRPAGNLERYNFNNRASSAIISGEAWELCDQPGFSGRCVVLQPGTYESLEEMNDSVTSMRPLGARSGPVAGGPAADPQGPRGPEFAAPSHSPGLTLYEYPNFSGASLFVERPRRRFERADFDSIASSAIVSGAAWEVCDGEEYSGRCVILKPGRFASLDRTGMNNRISSARPAGPR